MYLTFGIINIFFISYFVLLYLASFVSFSNLKDSSRESWPVAELVFTDVWLLVHCNLIYQVGMA